MRATANFYYADHFYKAGDEVPKEVASVVGKHLFAKGDAEPPTQAPVKAPETPQTPPAGATTQQGDDETPEGAQGEPLTREDLEALSAKELVELAKGAGITGKHNKAELIEKLLEA